MTSTPNTARPDLTDDQRNRWSRRGRAIGLAAAAAVTATAAITAAGPASAAAPTPVPPHVRTAPVPGWVDALTSARDGSLWAAERSPADLVRIAGGTAPTHVPLPGLTSATSLAPRTGSSVWFARPGSGSIGWTEAVGTVRELTVGGAPRWTASDGTGGVWILDPVSAVLDRRDVNGARLASLNLGSISAETVSVALVPLATDGVGQPWVARRTYQSTEVGRRRSDGSFAWSILPTTSRAYPLALAAGPDGAMWGTAQSDAGGVLFRADAAGAKVVHTFPMTTIGALTTGPDGNLWTSLAASGVPAPGRLVRVDLTGNVLQQITAPTGTGAAEHLAATSSAVAASLPGGTSLPSIELPIASAYQRLGGAGSVVGSPRSAEQPIPTGWARTFATGRMLWSPASGAHEVHGLILARYLAFGADRSLLGLPVTDEFTPLGSSAVKPVRASRFQHGLVLWSTRTAAHEVHGLILARYEQLGGPTGRLGLPVSDELTVGPGVKESRFEHGTLRWSASTGVQITYR